MKLSEKYKKEIIPAMMKIFGYKSPMAVPKLKKIVLNVGFGKEISKLSGQEKEKFLKYISETLAKISGQKPVFCQAKKSISGFKLKKGSIIGAKVTLRRKKMYDFLERLIYLTLPRTRDFRGIDQKSLDEKGNLTIGIREITSFPEVVLEKEKQIFPLEVTIVTTAKTKKEGKELLRLLGVPFKK